MGDTISHVEEEAAKRGQEDAKTANDALNALQQIAAKNLRLFEIELPVIHRKHPQIPIDKIVAKSSVIQCCGASNSSHNIQNMIENSLKSFTSGKFVNAITEMLAPTMDILLGNFVSNVSETKNFVLSVGPSGGVYRIDYYIYAYQFTSNALVSAVTKHVIATSIVVSSIKTKDLKASTMDSIIQYKFSGIKQEEQKKLLNEMVNAMKQQDGDDCKIQHLKVPDGSGSGALRKTQTEKAKEKAQENEKTKETERENDIGVNTGLLGLLMKNDKERLRERGREHKECDERDQRGQQDPAGGDRDTFVIKYRHHGREFVTKSQFSMTSKISQVIGVLAREIGASMQSLQVIYMGQRWDSKNDVRDSSLLHVKL